MLSSKELDKVFASRGRTCRVFSEGKTSLRGLLEKYPLRWGKRLKRGVKTTGVGAIELPTQHQLSDQVATGLMFVIPVIEETPGAEAAHSLLCWSSWTPEIRHWIRWSPASEVDTSAGMAIDKLHDDFRDDADEVHVPRAVGEL